MSNNTSDRELVDVIIQSNSYEETRAFGQKLAEGLAPGDIVALYGRPGAGKTALAGGILCGLGHEGYATSPTYTIVNEYHDTRIPAYHFDLYRLDADSVEDIGILDYLERDAVCIVEWPQAAESFLKCTLVVDIEVVDDQRRTIEIQGKNLQRFSLEG